MGTVLPPAVMASAAQLTPQPAVPLIAMSPASLPRLPPAQMATGAAQVNAIITTMIIAARLVAIPF